MSDDAYNDWLNANIEDLEGEFLSKFVPPEDVPLDDDLPDFFANSDTFLEYCENQFKDFVNAGGLE